jgi:hypothetical protein
MDVLLLEWRKMSVGGRVARVVSWVVYLGLGYVALRDMAKRGEDGVRGKLWMWGVGVLPIVSVFGFGLPVVEVLYFLVGRRKQ